MYNKDLIKRMWTSTYWNISMYKRPMMYLFVAFNGYNTSRHYRPVDNIIENCDIIEKIREERGI